MPPMHEIAHLAHVELRTPVPEQSLEFFTSYLGLTVTGSAGDSVFLHAWDDYEQTTVKLTGHATSGVGRTNLRAASPEALERRVKEIQASGRGVGWADGDPGYGPTYVFTDPDGHEFGLYYESQWYAPPPAPSIPRIIEPINSANHKWPRRHSAVTAAPSQPHRPAIAVDPDGPPGPVQ
jgi:catechol 2,3-dioxygenase